MATYRQSKKALEKLKRRRELKEKFLSFRHFLTEFLVIMCGYGFLINFSLSATTGFPFTLYTLPGLGIAYYLIRYELGGPDGMIAEWIRFAKH